jgi:uncharacterized cupredoxin-like copper-binding protein
MARASILALGAMFLAASALAHGDKPHEKTPPPGEHAGHGAEVGEPGDPKQVIRTFQISMGDDMKFRPAVLTVRQGETIKLVVKNAGKLKHELVIGTQAELEAHAKEMEKNPDMEHDDPNAAHVDPGKTATLFWKFTKRGEVPFACLIPGHMQGGMVGKVIVNP